MAVEDKNNAKTAAGNANRQLVIVISRFIDKGRSFLFADRSSTPTEIPYVTALFFVAIISPLMKCP
jgi:hypothetical protein